MIYGVPILYYTINYSKYFKRAVYSQPQTVRSRILFKKYNFLTV